MSGRDYLGEFELVVLLALARLGDDAYGASIHREILQATGRDVSIPAVYVTLKRMERGRTGWARRDRCVRATGTPKCRGRSSGDLEGGVNEPLPLRRACR